jgi:hypothetical protein
MSEGREPGKRESRAAPIVVFGAMAAIGLTGLIAVLVTHCQREEPYLDATPIRPGDPAGVQLPGPPPTAPK